jgi:hypothetical protein
MSEGKSYQQLSVNESLVAIKDMQLVQYVIMKYHQHFGINLGFCVNV